MIIVSVWLSAERISKRDHSAKIVSNGDRRIFAITNNFWTYNVDMRQW